MRIPRPLKVARKPALSRRRFLAGSLVLAAGCRTPALLDSASDSGPDSDPLRDSPSDSPSDSPGDSPLHTGDTGDTGEVEPVETFDASLYAEDVALFPTAVMAGVIETASARLACTVGDAQPVRCVVFDAELALLQEHEVTPSETGAVMLDVTGLPQPGAWYGYCFLRESEDAETVRSAVGRFRAALDEAALEPLRLAIGACNGVGNDPWPTMSVTAGQEPDLFLHLGDMAYNDGRTSAEDLRDNWRWYLSGDGYRELFAACGLLATWDDHEVTNNWTPASVEDELEALCKEVYFEHIPVWRDEETGRIWRSYRWGLTAEIFVLDCRSERVPDSRNTDEAEYISLEQMDWLKQALVDSPCVFKIVMNSVPITNMPTLWDLAAEDRWEGYDAQRDELLLQLSAEGIEDVYFVSGDFHVCFAALIEPGMGGAAGRTFEVACTSGNSNILGEFLVDTDPDQFFYGTSSARAVILDLDPDTREVTVRFLDGDGNVDEELVLTQA
jgi:3',5'-cyclic AMP phosphodiesterase CpdA